MTIPSNVTRNSYTGTGITGPYPVTFKFFEDADLKVTVADTNSVETVKVLTTDYTVTGAGEQAGGSITFTTAVTTGYSIVIEPKADLTQDTDIKNEGGNLRESIEDRFDRLCRDDQVQQNSIDRSVKVQITDVSVADPVLPPREAGSLIGWNDSGTGFANRAASLFASDAAITSTGSTTARWISDRFADMVNVKDFGAVGDGVTDDTAAIQAAIDSGNSLHFGSPSDVYAVTSLNFNKNGKVYDFNGSTLLGISEDAYSGIIVWTAGYCTCYGLAISGNWNSNYASAIHWHSVSAGAPAQGNLFVGLAISDALIGIVFGQISPTVPVDSAQSENYIHGMRTRGVERCVYFNQPNGFLKIIGGQLAASKNEWDIAAPGVYDYARSCVVTILEGSLGIIGGDVQKTDTQLGYGFINTVGELSVNGCNIEVASRIFSGSGSGITHFTGMPGGYWANASDPWAYLSGAGGFLRVSGFVLNKADGAWGANTAFLHLGTATDWDVTLSECRLINQRELICSTVSGADKFGVWTGGNDVRFINCVSVASAGAGGSPIYPEANSTTHNLLDLRGTDCIGNDIGTWYARNLVGTGALALNADVPAGTTFSNSMQVTPQATVGRTAMYNCDLTSLATVKATAIKVKPGDQFVVSGWFKLVADNPSSASCLWLNAAGTAIAATDLAVNNTTLLNTTWTYFSAMVTAPLGVAYLGVGIDCSNGIQGRMVGISVNRLN